MTEAIIVTLAAIAIVTLAAIASVVGVFFSFRTLFVEDESYREASRKYDQNMRECWEELREWRESIEATRRRMQKTKCPTSPNSSKEL